VAIGRGGDSVVDRVHARLQAGERNGRLGAGGIGREGTEPGELLLILVEQPH